jgi:hypothetical protein
MLSPPDFRLVTTEQRVTAIERRIPRQTFEIVDLRRVTGGLTVAQQDACDFPE